MRNDNSINRSDIFALFALLVSMFSIYFSFFYHNRDLSVSLIDSNVEYNGSNIKVKLLYNNQGNTYSTIIQDYLVFYQGKNYASNGLMFNNPKQFSEMEYNSVILTPGEQCLRTIDVAADFSIMATYRPTIALNDTINIGLMIQYINQTVRKSGDMFPIGYILLNTNRKIIKYRLDYNVFKLKGDNFYPGVMIK